MTFKSHYDKPVGNIHVLCTKLQFTGPLTYGIPWIMVGYVYCRQRHGQTLSHHCWRFLEHNRTGKFPARPGFNGVATWTDGASHRTMTWTPFFLKYTSPIEMICITIEKFILWTQHMNKNNTVKQNTFTNILGLQSSQYWIHIMHSENRRVQCKCFKVNRPTSTSHVHVL